MSAKGHQQTPRSLCRWELGPFGESLDTILSQQRAGRDEPVFLVLHMACPRVEYTDRGKSAVVIQS